MYTKASKAQTLLCNGQHANISERIQEARLVCEKACDGVRVCLCACVREGGFVRVLCGCGKFLLMCHIATVVFDDFVGFCPSPPSPPQYLPSPCSSCATACALIGADADRC